MMENYEPLMSFGEDAAEIYDVEPDAGHRSETLATGSFLESLAGGGPALELAIGTGRVALPLAARSLPSTFKCRGKSGGSKERKSEQEVLEK